jgi:non-ribosomal peptide synthetase component F/acyl carrier protein
VRLVFAAGYAHLDASQVILQVAPLWFDASTFEIWGALLHGGKCVLFPGRIPTAAELKEILKEHGVTTLLLTPALFNAVADEDDGKALFGLRQLFFGGDMCSVPHVRRAQKTLTGTHLVHLYGPTESTTVTTYFPLEGPIPVDASSIPIGKPIGNTRVYVLDAKLDPQPLGVVGDLYIAGAGLARGYHKRPGLTAERFVADSYGAPGSRMYRTGDLARWRTDGTVEFLGRTDHQVKIRGFRVELGEIEAALREQGGVHEAAVLALEDQSGNKRLIAYVTSAMGQNLDPGSLRQNLSQRLPEYMLPATVILLNEFPLTPSGKLDRKALPAPDFETGSKSRVPHTPEEEILCGLFAEMLGLDEVGIDDDFFDLGGHSLMAATLVSRIRATWSIALSIDTFFEFPSVAQLAPQLRGMAPSRSRLTRKQRPEGLPLSHPQQRLWFLDRAQGTSAEYNVPGALRLLGELDRQALQRAIDTIVERHEVLRTRFVEFDGQPVQSIQPELRIQVPFEDLTCLDEDARSRRLHAALCGEVEQPFNLEQGPLVRLKLLKLSDCDHVLLLTMHHIVSDGWSQWVFNRELMTLYEAYHEGRENPLEPLQVQYADFTLWQREWLTGAVMDEGLAYWQQQLAGIPQELGLPTDRPRPEERSSAAEMCYGMVTAEQVSGLKQLSRENHSTLYMTLLAGFAVLMSHYSELDDVVVGSPIANRQDARLEDLIGFFVNTLVMRVRVKPELTFRKLLLDVRRTALSAYRYQDVPFERLVEALSPKRSLNRTPIIQVMFALQNAPWVPQQLKRLQVEPIRGDQQRVRTDLEVHAFERDSEILLCWLYSRDLFDRWRIEQMVRHYLRLLEMVTRMPDEPLDRIEILDETELKTILKEFNEHA